MPPLDPIVSLAVALAEAPGTHALLLGSGVSKDAEIPTGWEVLRATQRRLRDLELSSDSTITQSETVSDDELDAWLREAGHEHLTYSELLELVYPDAPTRRAYLASFFEGRKPGPTHEALADLAVRGMVKVFVTPNFDRLLEHALQARGIEPVVIASDADLETQVPREHAACVIIKPHGDYLQQTIRNTVAELAELDPGMTKELSEVFDRYGLVVLGYSGSDPAITAVLRARRSRYGLWWVARRKLESHLGELVREVAGRVIERDSASAFLADLNSRLAIFEQHPSGITPATVHDQILRLLRTGDSIGLAEELRRERQAWRSALVAVVEDARYNRVPNNSADVRAAWTSLFPHLERRLAGLMPLATYSSEDFLTELKGLAQTIERCRRDIGGYATWTELPNLATAVIGYILGAWLVNAERYESLGSLLGLKWSDPYGHQDRVVELLGSAQDDVGNAMIPPDRPWNSPIWAYLTRCLDGSAWVAERYPELVESGEPDRSLAQFDLLVTLHSQFAGEQGVAHWAMFRDYATGFARSIASDAALRTKVAMAVGTDLERFDAEAPAALANAHQLGRVGQGLTFVIDALKGAR